MSRVVVSHHHHPEEGVYRLVHAEATESHRWVEVENPDFDPEAEDSPRTVFLQEATQVLSDFDDVIWAADDDRWKGMTRAAIARQQREDVSRAFAEREARAAEAAAKSAAQASRRVDLGGGGKPL